MWNNQFLMSAFTETANHMIHRYEESSRYTFHYRKSITVNVLSKASRACQRKMAVTVGCPIIITFIITFTGNICVRELYYVYTIDTHYFLIHDWMKKLKILIWKNFSMLVKQNICKSELFPAPIFFYNERICKFYSVLQFWLSSKKCHPKTIPSACFFHPNIEKFFQKEHFWCLYWNLG